MPLIQIISMFTLLCIPFAILLSSGGNTLNVVEIMPKRYMCPQDMAEALGADPVLLWDTFLLP
jgi:hypothetical protein